MRETPTRVVRGFGVAFALLALLVWGAGFLIPDIASKPFEIEYSGQKVGPISVPIEVAGHYDVRLALKGSLRPPLSHEQPILKVTAFRNGKPIGAATKSAWWSRKDSGFVCFRFDAERADVIELSVAPARGFAPYRNEPMQLSVRRFPFEFLFHGATLVVWRLLIAAFAIGAALFFVLSLKLRVPASGLNS